MREVGWQRRGERLSEEEGGRGGGHKLGSDLDLDPWKILWIRFWHNDADPLGLDLQHFLYTTYEKLIPPLSPPSTFPKSFRRRDPFRRGRRFPSLTILYGADKLLHPPTKCLQNTVQDSLLCFVFII